jgi:predicted ATPase/DNA-binding CsgD family transcriptional regulator
MSPRALPESDGRRGAAFPHELTSLVGRGRELAQAKELLSRTRLLTLVGCGGVGKSRLAARVATRTARAFPGGIGLAELGDVRDPRLVRATVDRAVGGTLATGSGESLDRASLLVLDNCEHVLEELAEVALELLQRDAALRILATSREPLGVSGEVTLSVLPLVVPGSAEGRTADGVLSFAAAQLFVERAVDADPAFELTDANAPLVAEICRRVDGLPLGLELAAMRVRTLTLEQLVQRLDDPLSLTNLSSRTAPARHRTLEATLKWSHDLMGEEEQILWRRLSAFAGGFTLETARAVCADDRLPQDAVFDALTALAEKSVVVNDRTSSGRRRLLEPARLFGRGHLRTAGEECEFLNRHRAVFCALAAGNGSPWWTGDGELVWMLRVDDERENLRAALDFCLVDSNEEIVQAGLELAFDLWLPWVVHGRYAELRQIVEGLLAKSTVPSPARARALFAASLAARVQGELDTAEELIGECRRITRNRRNHPLEQGLALYGVGASESARGRFEAAREHLEGAAALFSGADAPVLEAVALYMLAETYSDTDPKRARALMEQSLAVSEHRGEVCIRSVVHCRLGLLESLLGDNESAEANIQAGLRLHRQIGHRWGMAAALEALAWVGAGAGQPERAAGLLGAADSLWGSLQIDEPPQLVGHRHACEEAVRDELGDEEFVALYERGGALRLDETLALALGEEATGALVGGNGELSMLTPRERQVVHLVATGATNREVAAKLVISYQTVKTHLHHVLAKLGFDSRVELAAWYARQHDHSAGATDTRPSA